MWRTGQGGGMGRSFTLLVASDCLEWRYIPSKIEFWGRDFEEFADDHGYISGRESGHEKARHRKRSQLRSFPASSALLHIAEVHPQIYRGSSQTCSIDDIYIISNEYCAASYDT